MRTKNQNERYQKNKKNNFNQLKKNKGISLSTKQKILITTLMCFLCALAIIGLVFIVVL